MKQTFTYSSYLSKMLIIAALFFVLPIIFSFGGALSTTGSYISSCLCFFSLTIISVYLILGKKYVKFYSLAFVIQVLVGLIHYLLFIDSDYFNTSGYCYEGFWHEYNSVFSSIDRLIHNRQDTSIFYFDSDDWTVTHPEIWRIITVPITYLGNKWLNYAPLNAFSSLLASINLVVIYKYRYVKGLEDKKSVFKWILYVSAFFPLFILNDTLWRDAFGVALISIGLVLLTLSNSNVGRKILSLIILVYFSFLLRNVYVFVAGFSFAIHELRRNRKGATILMLPIAAVALFIINNFFQSNTSEDYIDNYLQETSFLAWPLKFVMGLIGPFPWTQFLLVFEGRPVVAYQLGDYILGLFQLGYFIAIVKSWKSFSFKNLDYPTLMGIGMAFAGLISHSIHVGYIAEGIYFTLPWFFTQIGNNYKKYLQTSFLILLILNIIVISMGGLGLMRLLH